MAPKRANPIEVPPPAASSEEEEDEEVTSSDEEEGEGSSTEEEEDDDPKSQSTPLAQKTLTPKKPDTPMAVNEESEESGSESESESDTATPNVKPIATKPMEENSKKPRSKPLASPIRASSSKRPGESDQETKDAKRPKKKAGEDGLNSVSTGGEEVKKTGEDAKKQLFQRLFSEDDEIALLKGMLDYSAAKKGADPVADMNAFYDFVKKSIHTDVTKAQLMDKIRRLKKKYENNAGKGKKGEDRTFSKVHDQNAFELSKMIWGKEGISGKVDSSAAKSNGKAKGNNKAVVALKAELHPLSEKKVDVRVPMEVDNNKVSKNLDNLFDKKLGVSNMEEEIVKRGMNIHDAEKKSALEAKWQKIQMRELEVFVERNEFVTEMAKTMLESFKTDDK